MMPPILFTFIGDPYSLRIYRTVPDKMIQPHIGDHDHHVHGGDSGERREIHVYLESLSNTLLIIEDNIMMLIVCPLKKKLYVKLL